MYLLRSPSHINTLILIQHVTLTRTARNTGIAQKHNHIKEKGEHLHSSFSLSLQLHELILNIIIRLLNIMFRCMLSLSYTSSLQGKPTFPYSAYSFPSSLLLYSLFHLLVVAFCFLLISFIDTSEGGVVPASLDCINCYARC